MDLLERAPQLERLLGLLHEATHRHGLLLLLGGEAGVGKSVFVQHFSQRVDKSVRVLVGMCDPLSTPRPLGPLVDIAAVMGGELAGVMETENRDRVFRGLLSTLQRVARPMVVVFEDVHWADEATLDLLHFLGRRLNTTRTLLIATYRDDEVGPRHPLRVVMGDLATSATIRRLTLPPLSEGAVRSLAEGSPLDAAELHRQTGGNPFFVTEVLASGGESIPLSVRDAVLARAARLSATGRATLETAAVIGFRIEPWVLEETAGSDATAVEACISVGMLRPQQDLLAFRHELARDAILQALSPQRSVTLHGKVLKVLRSSSHDDLARLAHHAEAAGDRQAVLEYAPKAARRATELKAHREAAVQYARALRFAAALTPPDRAQLLEDYAYEGALVDLLSEAIAALQDAAALRQQTGEPLTAGVDLSYLARLLVLAGRNAEGEAASRAALAVLEPLPLSAQHARAYQIHAHLRMLDRDNAEAAAWGQRALALAEHLGNTAYRHFCS